MRIIICFLFLSLPIGMIAQTLDTTRTLVNRPVSKIGQPVQKVEYVTLRTDLKFEIFGDYIIEKYVALSKKTLSEDELNAIVGSVVKVQATSITGVSIDPMSINIYQVERLHRDDFVYRVFGSDIKLSETDLPESFNVHKTDNENCYGIVEINSTHIAIPYKGVLLFLKKKV